MIASYVIDGVIHDIDFRDSEFSAGNPILLSNADNDVTHSQEWYSEGFCVRQLFGKDQFQSLVRGIGDCIHRIAGRTFPLDQYHKNVSESDHYKVVGVTRDLFPSDFNFPVSDIVEKLEGILGFQLTDIDPDTNKKLRIILRINRPHSTDYNPPHKDIYESFDRFGLLPRLVNFWIPICGVTKRSMLPVAPRSHLIPEDKILRTKVGGVIEDKNYRVRSVLSWDGQTDMCRPEIDYGQVLVFTPHLIHGCAINEQEDATRFALEFRLFSK